MILGRSVPIRDPLLNGKVLGQDSVLEATFGGKIHWFWGDTNRPSYPLGTFGTPGATSLLPGAGGGLDPELGVDFDYTLAPDGFVAPTADLQGRRPNLARRPDGPARPDPPRRRADVRQFRQGPRIDGGLPSGDLPSTTRRRDASSSVTPIPLDAPIRPFGHPFPTKMGGVDYVVFADPFPLVRVRADVEHFLDLAAYEAFTCLLPGSPERGHRPARPGRRRRA